MKIILKDISQVFKSTYDNSFCAIDNISLKINENKNEFIGIIGETGSGKTTLIEHLNALLVPTSGSVTFEYDCIKKNKKTKQEETIHVKNEIRKRKIFKKIKDVKSIRKRIGIVFQFAEYQLFEETIEKDIIFGPINMGVSKEEAKKRAKDIIQEVGLPVEYLSKSPFELSGGQKRRVALAGILAMNPDILIFDEPTAGLDPHGSKEILEIFKNLYNKGKTIIIVSHNLDDILEYTNRLIVLTKGKKIKDGNTLEILSDIEFLLKNNLMPPKLLSFIHKLNENSKIKVPFVKNINQLADEINKIKKESR